MNTYLLEIGLEEMPAQMILPAVEQLKNHALKTCNDFQLGEVKIDAYSTPRRLAVKLSGLPERQADRVIELKGPPAAMAKNEDDSWSKAALGFAKKNKVETDDLEIKNHQGKDYLFAKKEEIGLEVTELLEGQIGNWLNNLSFPKNMRWGSYRMKFIRPIRWILSLWNNQVVPLKLEMVEAAHSTRGHRFLSKGINILNHAADYEQQMNRLFVMANFSKRKENIVTQIQALEKEHGFDVKLDEDLLEEVTNLVEWPTVILGSFEEEFLELPSEVLVTSMAVHQRYFPVYEKTETENPKLLSHFVTVRNGNDTALDTVRKGNAKVLRARLSDARFFFLEDQKKELDEFCQLANRVVFFQERGSQAQRVERIKNLSLFIAEKLQLSNEQQKTSARIAELCKFDLDTQVVYEFPELQGFMGSQYARLKNEDEQVCQGIEQHYFPRNSQDALPENIETVPVAIADKLDMLVTAFSLNMIPTGAADPYALRRMAQGVTQLILQMELKLSPVEIISEGVRLLDEQQSLQLDQKTLVEKLLDFMDQRTRWFMQEKGVRYDLIDALMKANSGGSEKRSIPIEQLKLAEYFAEHLETEPFRKTVEAVVRATNISEKNPEKIPAQIDASNLSLDEERDFYNALKFIQEKDISHNWEPEDFYKKLQEIEPVVTKFFDEVMVMDEDPIKCGQRLWLCQQLSSWSGRHLDLRTIVFS